MNKETAYYFVCMGKMTKTAKISISSILTVARLDSLDVYIFADTPGKRWVLENFKNIGQFKFISIEIENLSSSQKNRFSSNYQADLAQFGTDEMKLITPFKWEGILKVFEIDPTLQTLIVSDIDVIWKKNPFEQIEFLLASSYYTLIQDDTPEGSKGYYCTGIQIWRNTSKARIYIKSLLDFHRQSHLTSFRYRGMLLGDEKAFNLFMAEKNSSNLFYPLDKRDFVIGHRVRYAILRLLINKWPTAVHANYTLSDDLKFHKLNSFNNSLFGWVSRALILFSFDRVKL